MGVGPLQAAAPEHVAQPRIEIVRELRVPRVLGREMAQRGEHGLRAQRALDLERLEDGEESAFGVLAAQGELLAHVLLPAGIEIPGTCGTGCGGIVRQGRDRRGPAAARARTRARARRAPVL